MSSSSPTEFAGMPDTQSDAESGLGGRANSGSSSLTGFAGLSKLQSDVESELARLAGPAAPNKQAAASAAPLATPQDDGSWNRAVVIGAAIVAVIALGAIVSSRNSATTYNPAPLPAADATAPSPSSDTMAASSLAEAPVSEEAPPAATGAVLSANQIAYCLAEKVRIGSEQPRVNDGISSEVAAFNAAVDDYNARCGQFRYAQEDLAKARAYVDGRRQELEAQGAARVESEAPVPSPPEAPIPPPPQAPGADVENSQGQTPSPPSPAQSDPQT